MNWTDKKKLIQKAIKAHGHPNYARLQIEGSKLVIRNRATNVIHPFSEGMECLTLGKSELIKVNDLLK